MDEPRFVKCDSCNIEVRVSGYRAVSDHRGSGLMVELVCPICGPREQWLVKWLVHPGDAESLDELPGPSE